MYKKQRGTGESPACPQTLMSRPDSRRNIQPANINCNLKMTFMLTETPPPLPPSVLTLDCYDPV